MTAVKSAEQALRALNIAVSERRGWVYHPPVGDAPPYWTRPDRSGLQAIEDEPLDWATEIALAWVLVECMAERGYNCSLHKLGTTNSVHFWRPLANDLCSDAVAATIPEAICEAYLEAPAEP